MKTDAARNQAAQEKQAVADERLILELELKPGLKVFSAANVKSARPNSSNSAGELDSFDVPPQPGIQSDWTGESDGFGSMNFP